MNTSTVSDTTALRQQTHRLKISLALFTFGCVFLTLLFLFLGNQQLKRFHNLVQEYQTILETRIATTNLYSLASSKIQGLTVIASAFPDESSIIDVLEKLEQLVHSLDPQGTVKFAPQSAGNSKNQTNVTLTFHFTATPTDTVAFLRRLERVPQILEVNLLEITPPQGISNPADVTLGVTLYVQDPFNQSE